MKRTIAKVVQELTDVQRERLASKRDVSTKGLARSYQGDWVTLLQDMTDAEVRRALSTLEADELRVVALRAFDGVTTDLERIKWKDDGNAPRKRRAKGIVEALCVWGPERLQEETWKKDIEPRLREIGIESDDAPKSNKDHVLLRRIF